MSTSTTLPTAFLFEAKQVHVTDTNGDLWFSAPDVCRILEITNVTNAIRILDPDEKGLQTLKTLGGPQTINCISEPGLYKLIARSSRPVARTFDRWVRHEVLPALRKTGAYAAAPVAQPREMPPLELLSRALLLANDTVTEVKAKLAIADGRIAESDVKISHLEPKAQALERIAASEGSMCLRDAAKAISVKPKLLNEALLERGWLYRSGEKLVGMQKRIDAGHIEMAVVCVPAKKGSDRTYTQVRVTPRGLAILAIYFPKDAPAAANTRSRANATPDQAAPGIH